MPTEIIRGTNSCKEDNERKKDVERGKEIVDWVLFIKQHVLNKGGFGQRCKNYHQKFCHLATTYICRYGM